MVATRATGGRWGSGSTIAIRRPPRVTTTRSRASTGPAPSSSAASSPASASRSAAGAGPPQEGRGPPGGSGGANGPPAVEPHDLERAVSAEQPLVGHGDAHLL